MMWSVWARLPVSLTIVSFAFFGQTHSQWLIEDEGCRTPDRGVGNCIPLPQCAPMVNVIKSLKKPTSQTILKRLQAYTCGPDETGVKVCCPPGPIILDPNTRSTRNRDEPPDVTNHTNLYLLPKDCGYLDQDDKFIKGVDAYLNEFPWMALLRYKRNYTGVSSGEGFNCGGTIINKNYILTAGHCVTSLSSSELVSVRIGEHSIKNETDCETLNSKKTCNPPVQDVNIEEIIPHPEFGTESFLNDIGLIRVSTMNLNVVNARPVCLPLGNPIQYATVTVIGWGATDTATGEISDILQKVALPVADKENCTKTYDTHNIKLDKSQICAGGVQNKDSCHGDGGGPMLVLTIDETTSSAKYVQEGIVSFGPKFCGIEGYPGVYTLVKYYMDWILDTIKP